VIDAKVMRLDAGPPTSRFVPATPTRLLDTRTGLGATAGRVPPGDAVTLQVTGRGGVPATATAVVLTVTEAEADPGYVTVWPTGGAKPVVSNLNTTRHGQTVAAQVVAPVGTDGRVDLFSSGGGQLVADLAGWYEPTDTAAAGRYIPLTPSRLVDTRTTARPAAGSTTDVAVAGRGGVPASGVAGVIVTVTSVDSSPGFLTVWPKGAARPTASNLNPGLEGQTIADHVTVPLGADGGISVYTSGGGHVLVDVVGWFTDASAPASTSGLFVPLPPNRRLDTRGPIGVATSGRRAASSTTLLSLGGNGGLPPAGVLGVVANVTAVDADPLYVTVWPAGPKPTVSNLNVTVGGDTVADLVTTPVTSVGDLRIATSGATHLLADVAGYYVA
jgi:hypothetical protein